MLTALVASATLPSQAAEPATPQVTIHGKRLTEQYPDLEPDHPLNPYRVAPSSRLSVQTFTADDIEAMKPLDVFDLLNHAVGVLALYQGRKVPYSVRIRGDLYFAYFIDGVYLPSEAGGRILQNLPVGAIEQLEVVRDATALTLAPMVDFGRPSGAPNDGYIVIRTRRPLGTEGGATLRAESFGTQSGSVHAGTTTGQGYVYALGSHYDTDGRSGEYMAKRTSSGLARAGWQWGGLRVEASVFSDHTRQQIQAADPFQSSLGPQRWQLDPLDSSFIALNLGQTWNGVHTSTLTLSRYRLTADLQAGTVLPGVAAREFPNEETIDHIDFKHTARWGDTLVRAGGQWMHWDTPTGASYYEGYPREERITGAFATVEHALANRRWVFDAAVRADRQHVIRGVDHYYAYQMLFQQPMVHDRRLPASRFVSLGAAWTPSPRWQLNLRAYAARQGAVDAVPAVDNKVLHPESQRKLEAGLAWAGWTWLKPTLTIFHTRIENTKYPARETRAQNGLAASLWDERTVNRRGFELMVRGAGELLGGAIDYSAGWTWLGGDATNEDYGRTTPRNTLTYSIRYQHGPWDAAVSMTGVSRFESNWKALDERFHPIGDYTRLDLNVGRSFRLGGLKAHWSLYGRNVLDQRYQTQLGYRDIGAIWGAELRFTL